MLLQNSWIFYTEEPVSFSLFCLKWHNKNTEPLMKIKLLAHSVYFLCWGCEVTALEFTLSPGKPPFYSPYTSFVPSPDSLRLFPRLSCAQWVSDADPRRQKACQDAAASPCKHTRLPSEVGRLKQATLAVNSEALKGTTTSFLFFFFAFLAFLTLLHSASVSGEGEITSQLKPDSLDKWRS